MIDQDIHRSCQPVRSRLARLKKILKRSFLAILFFLLGYSLLLLIGLIPVNNQFVEAEDGVTIYLISDAVHADIVLPISSSGTDWRTMFRSNHFGEDTSVANYVAIGWGDKGFYLETPTWAELKASTACKAMLWPSSACLHVKMIEVENLREDTLSVTISEEQYAKLVGFIEQTFQRDSQGDIRLIPDSAYGKHDAFFEAEGSYNCVHTCNQWVCRAMQKAGIRTPWLAPLPQSAFIYLDNKE